jgi:cytoskeletal protein CcmA (bactofilin family)
MRYLLIFLLFCSGLFSDEQGNFIVLPEGQVHQGDFFASGNSVEISGTVKGNVYAFGSQVIVDGTIEGDVIAAAGVVAIAGEVKGSVRVAGGEVDLAGKIGRNVTILAGSLEISSPANIEGNITAMAGNLDMEGSIQGKATFFSSQLRISGFIGKELTAYVGHMRLTSRAKVDGNIEYNSDAEALVDEGAEIKGSVKRSPSGIGDFFGDKVKKRLALSSRILGTLMNFIFSFVLGCILIKLFPNKYSGCLEVLRRRPGKTFMVGVLVALLLPLVCLLLFITILGVPFAIALIALNILGFYSAKIVTILWLAEGMAPKLRIRPGSLWLLFIGLIAYFLIKEIPLIGKLTALAVMLLGLGAIFSRPRRFRRKPHPSARELFKRDL